MVTTQKAQPLPPPQSPPIRVAIYASRYGIRPRGTHTCCARAPQGDLFSNSGKDNTGGLLYLSRMDSTRYPRKKRQGLGYKTRCDELGVSDREDTLAKKEVRGGSET